MVSQHLAKYRELLRRSLSRIGPAVPDHKLFEYAWALELEMLLYDDVPPHYVGHLRCKRDFGTDLVSLDCSTAAQVKYYLRRSVDHADLSKFYMHAKALLGCTRLLLCTTPEASFSTPAQDDLRGSGMVVLRASLQDLVEKHLAEESAPAEKKRRVAVDEPCPLLLRKGQAGLRAAFSSHRDSTPFRAQLPCGYGKTVALGVILEDELDVSGDAFRCLVLVPWIDLLDQSKKTLQALLPQARFAVLGGGASATPVDFDVLLATHAALRRVADELKHVVWSLVVLDEAHHCHEDSARRDGLDTLDFRRLLELSATFPASMKPDFHVSLRDAIDEGVVSDYRIHIVELSEGDRLAALIDLFKDRRVEWGATLAVFTSLSRAASFVEGLAAKHGLAAAALTAATPASERLEIKRRLEEGELVAAACVGVWNEGVDIPGLHTVLFADDRASTINKRQVSQRAGRIHPAKPYSRIVLAVQQGMEDVEDILQAFLREDPALCSALRSQQGGNVQKRLQLDTLRGGDADVVAESIWTSLGGIVTRLDQPSKEQKCTWLAQLFPDAPPPSKAEVVQEHGGAPYTFKAGQFWGSIMDNWTRKKAVSTLNLQQKQMLEGACPWIPGAVEVVVCGRKAKPSGEPAVEQKCTWLAQLFPDAPPPSKAEVVQEHGGSPYTFKAGGFWGRILNNWTGKKALSFQQKQMLEGACPWILGLVEVLVQGRKAKPSGEPAVEQKCTWLAQLFPTAAPPHKAEVVQEHSGAPYTFKAGHFWRNILDNWTRKKAASTLNLQQKQMLEGACPWIPGAVEVVVCGRKTKPSGEPAVEQKCTWLAQLFPTAAPPQKAEVVQEHGGSPYTFKAGGFWGRILNNWTGKKATTTLHLQQKQMLEGACPWIPGAAKAVVEKRHREAVKVTDLAPEVAALHIGARIAPLA